MTHMTTCPFCNHDPFHYVDNGVGMEAVAVTCCDLGNMYFRGDRETPEEVTVSWGDFQGIVAKLFVMRECLESIADMDDQDPRQPDDADWRFRALECKRAAEVTLYPSPRSND